jgi:hypothetical protein
MANDIHSQYEIKDYKIQGTTDREVDTENSW